MGAIIRMALARLQLDVPQVLFLGMVQPLPPLLCLRQMNT